MVAFLSREEKLRKGKRGEDVFDEFLSGECFANVCDEGRWLGEGPLDESCGATSALFTIKIRAYHSGFIFSAESTKFSFVLFIIAPGAAFRFFLGASLCY